MIDNTDIASSTIKLLAFEAIKRWNTDSIIRLLSDKDYIVRTMAARELQKRGDLHIFTEVIKLTESNVIYEREISAFILGQLGTPNAPFKDETIPVLNRLSLDISEEVSVSAICGIGHLCFLECPKIPKSFLLSCLIAIVMKLKSLLLLL